MASFRRPSRRCTPGLIEVIGTLNLKEAIEPSTAAAFERKKRKEREMASEETKKAANKAARKLRRKQKKGAAAAAQWLCLQKAKPQPKCCCPHCHVSVNVVLLGSSFLRAGDDEVDVEVISDGGGSGGMAAFRLRD